MGVRFLRRLGTDVTVNFVVATLPDPIDSHLQSYFDADFAVIQQAFVRHFFTPALYYLPWQEWLRMPEADQNRDRLFERLPGIVIFVQNVNERNEKSREKSEVLRIVVLLIVGEVPTAGVHVEAFREALDLIADFTADAEIKVKIIGPSASGSCLSLRQSLKAWHKHLVKTTPGIVTTKVDFITGSATSEEALNLLVITERCFALTI